MSTPAPSFPSSPLSPHALAFEVYLSGLFFLWSFFTPPPPHPFVAYGQRSSSRFSNTTCTYIVFKHI